MAQGIKNTETACNKYIGCKSGSCQTGKCALVKEAISNRVTKGLPTYFFGMEHPTNPVKSFQTR